MKEQIIKLLKNEKIEFNFDYDPFGEAHVECTNENLNEVLHEIMFDYVFNSGDPLSGQFEIKFENEELQIISKEKTSVDWTFSNILVFLGEFNFINKLEKRIQSAFDLQTKDWNYSLNVSKNNTEFHSEIKIFHSDQIKEIEFNEIPKELISFIENSINGPNKGAKNYGYELELSNTENENSFIEFFNLCIVIE